MKQSTLSFKSTKGTAAPKPQPKVVKRSVPLDDSSDEEENVSNRNLGEHLDLQDKKGHYRTLYKQAVAVSGDLVQAKDESTIHHILRVFDNTDAYGPCVGVSRLERWERAHEMGLNPPPEIQRILLSQQGMEDEMLSQCVFYGEV